MTAKLGLLERLRQGPVIGDGGYVFELEKRGYVMGGSWTPEATVEHPEAVRQLHREFLRCGSDVIQAFTFFASDDSLEQKIKDKSLQGSSINEEACKLAREVAAEGDALVCGGVSQTPSYREGADPKHVQDIFRRQIQVLVNNKVDFILCENIGEMELAISVAKSFGLPVAASMCIGQKGSLDGFTLDQCAVRMAKAGAEVVGLNCHHSPLTVVENIKVMKKGLEGEGLKPFLMAQPCGYHTTEAGQWGYLELQEFPFAMESRAITRFDAYRFARAAYDAGVRYLGGCCGFQPYHIRSLAEELLQERGGRRAPAMDKNVPWGCGETKSHIPWLRRRSNRQYWEELEPCSGRPKSSAIGKVTNK